MKDEHYTIGDALMVLFSNPLFYITLIFIVAMALGKL